MQAEVESKGEELASATEEAKTLEEEEKSLSSLRRKAESSLEEQRSTMQASRSRNSVLDNLMEQKRKGRIEGLHVRAFCDILRFVCVVFFSFLLMQR